MQVDRDPITINKFPALSLTESFKDNKLGDNEVQVGGLNTTDPRFTPYTCYSGCISSNFC